MRSTSRPCSLRQAAGARSAALFGGRVSAEGTCIRCQKAPVRRRRKYWPEKDKMAHPAIASSPQSCPLASWGGRHPRPCCGRRSWNYSQGRGPWPHTARPWGPPFLESRHQASGAKLHHVAPLWRLGDHRQATLRGACQQRTCRNVAAPLVESLGKARPCCHPQADAHVSDTIMRSVRKAEEPSSPFLASMRSSTAVVAASSPTGD